MKTANIVFSCKKDEKKAYFQDIIT